VAAVGLVVVTVLAGCGGDEPGAGATATVAPTATPTATPTPTADIPVVPVPVLPEEAKEYTSDGAIAFVHYAVEVINRAYVTGDTQSLLAIGTDDCPTCRRTAEDIDTVFASGNVVRGGAVTLEQTDWVALGENVIPTVPSVVAIAEMTEVAPDGRIVTTIPAESDLTMLWDLVWEDERWLLADVRGPERS
jgi:hypothetical protein